MFCCWEKEQIDVVSIFSGLHQSSLLSNDNRIRIIPARIDGSSYSLEYFQLWKKQNLDSFTLVSFSTESFCNYCILINMKNYAHWCLLKMKSLEDLIKKLFNNILIKRNFMSFLQARRKLIKRSVCFFKIFRR